MIRFVKLRTGTDFSDSTVREPFEPDGRDRDVRAGHVHLGVPLLPRVGVSTAVPHGQAEPGQDVEEMSGRVEGESSTLR